MASQIAAHLQEMGCSATTSTISHYVSKLKKQKTEHQLQNNPFTQTQFISRGKILSLLFPPVSSKHSMTEDQFKEVGQQYPMVQTIYKLVWEFKDIFKNKKMGQFSRWIEQTNN